MELFKFSNTVECIDHFNAIFFLILKVNNLVQRTKINRKFNKINNSWYLLFSYCKFCKLAPNFRKYPRKLWYLPIKTFHWVFDGPPKVNPSNGFSMILQQGREFAWTLWDWTCKLITRYRLLQVWTFCPVMDGPS